MKNNKIKVVIFDLGNVILNFDHMIASKKLSCVSKFSENYIYDLIFNSSLEEVYDKGKISSNEFYNVLKKELSLKISFQKFYELWGNIFWLNSGIIEVISFLKKRTKIVLLSNTNEIHFSYVLSKFTFLEKFDDFILSYKTGYRKPEKEIFLHIIKKMKCKPKEMIFIDDLDYNIKASIELGFNGILFKSNKQLKK